MSIVLLMGIAVGWSALCAIVVGMCWSAKEGDEPAGDGLAAMVDVPVGTPTGGGVVTPLALR